MKELKIQRGYLIKSLPQSVLSPISKPPDVGGAVVGSVVWGLGVVCGVGGLGGVGGSVGGNGGGGWSEHIVFLIGGLFQQSLLHFGWLMSLVRNIWFLSPLVL